MPEKYVWDAEAAKGIKAQDLDKHFSTNLNDYLKIVRPIWTILCKHNQQPSYLKHDDLYEPLVPIFARISMLQAALKKAGLPQTGQRGNAKWLCWFTHYVVEECLMPIKGKIAVQNTALAKLKIKNQDKIREEVEAELKFKKRSIKKPTKKAKGR